jgi:tetratricopeptide (TPR) repeat protein
MTDIHRAALADLHTRLARFDRDGDADVLFDADAHDRAQGLYSTVLARSRSEDAEALRLLARWFLHRYGALAAGAGQTDLRAARLCAALLRDLGGDELTDDLRDLLAGRVDHAVRTHETAMTILDQFDTTGDHDRVEVATELIEGLDDGLATDHPLRGELPVAAALLALARFTIRADPADVDDMVRAARQAVDLGRRHPETLPDRVCTLAHALALAFEHSGDLAHLDEAQRLTEAHLHDARGRLLANVASALANTLRMRAERTRSIPDLDRAVALSREAAAVLPTGHPGRSSALQTLAACLVRRVERLDRSDDLAEAIAVLRRIDTTLGPGGPVRAMWAANLAAMLTWRARRTRDLTDLAEAVALNRDAVAFAERLHGIRRLALHNLAFALLLRYGLTGQSEHLTEAIDTLRAAASEGTSATGPVQAMLAWATSMATHAGLGVDLGAVIAAGERALATLPPDHPDRMTALGALADAHRQRFQASGDQEDLAAAVRMWKTVSGNPVGRAELRMLAAREWLAAAVRARDLAGAADAATVAVRLLPVLAGRELDRAGQERRLAGVSGLAGNAAALAVELGRLEHAVELVERGRAVLWSQAVQTRGDLSELRAVDPGLAGRLEVTRRAINRAARAGTEPARHRELVARWDTLLASARTLPGFATFLDTPPFRELSAAAADGPVVVVNVSGPRCDALIVRPGQVRTVPLPWLSRDDARARADALVSALSEAETGERVHLRQTLTALLRWLWDTIASPILDDLDAVDGVRRHRVWWCPTGPLSMLPLHAAGRHTGSSRWHRSRPPTVPDRTVSSYTTGLVPLLRARRKPRPAESPLLAVGVPDAPGRARLPAVPEELRRITEVVPGAHTLTGASATPATVLGELARHQWAHFACHATHHVDRPGEGALHLAGGDLSVLRLAAHELDGADLAYLSACRTAGGAPALADETINLAAAFQLAGYRHVIGTQWSIADSDAAVVAESVYRRLTTTGRPDSTDAAAALSEATGLLRARYPDRPDRWAGYIHLGP